MYSEIVALHIHSSNKANDYVQSGNLVDRTELSTTVGITQTSKAGLRAAGVRSLEYPVIPAGRGT